MTYCIAAPADDDTPEPCPDPDPWDDIIPVLLDP